MNDPYDYAALLADLDAGRRFGFVRYSDGDWNCFFGRKGGVVNEHEYLPDLGAALRASLKSEPGYHVGIMSSLLTPGRWWAAPRVIEWTAAHPEVSFCSSMILHCASQRGELGPFFAALRGLRVSFVGNETMRGMQPWLGEFRLVEIPAQDCWLHRDEIVPRIIAAARQSDVVLFACSMPAKVWIRQTWESGAAASLIDVGSVLDPYVGRESRIYMRGGAVKLATPIGPPEIQPSGGL
ncbi:MAG TPA: hypothetical protein VMX97_09360 [Hyphomicrobiaceae bacterium]|nr:hypothetical protein [Hyphomicrobiaceae bacterium]